MRIDGHMVRRWLAALRKWGPALALCLAAVLLAVAAGRCYVLWGRVRAAACGGASGGRPAAGALALASWASLEEGIVINNCRGRWFGGTGQAVERTRQALASGWTVAHTATNLPGAVGGQPVAILTRGSRARCILPWRLPGAAKGAAGGAFEWEMDLNATGNLMRCAQGLEDMPGSDLPGLPRVPGLLRRASFSGSRVALASYGGSNGVDATVDAFRRGVSTAGWTAVYATTNRQGIFGFFRRGTQACGAWTGKMGTNEEVCLTVMLCEEL